MRNRWRNFLLTPIGAFVCGQAPRAIVAPIFCRAGRLPRTVGLWVFVLGISASAAQLESTLGSSSNWSALDWSADQVALFAGQPVSHGDKSRMLVVRYSFYTAEYSVQRKNPVWVAHIDTAKSATAALERTDGEWDRGGFTFTPDANVIAFARRLGVPWVTDDDFTKALSDEISAQRQSIDMIRDPRRITRGHMASNQEMKGHGDDATGMRSQRESFSLANASPQQMGHNSAIWHGIEEDCLHLAQEFKTVAVITGPVFHSSDRHIHYTNSPSPNALKIPIPSHFFKIVIVETGDVREALGFLVPHDASLKKADRFRFVTSVREIEDLTGINVMPKLGRNDAVEAKPSAKLLEFLRK